MDNPVYGTLYAFSHCIGSILVFYFENIYPKLSGCRKCGIDYGSSTELKLHFGAVHSRQTFECCVCNKLFIRRHGFLVHIKRFHEDVTGKIYMEISPFETT